MDRLSPMKTLTTLLLGLLCLAAEGQVVIYKGRMSITDTGGGFIKSYAVNAWLVWNPADATLSAVAASPSQKLFQINDLSDYYVETVTGPGRTFTVISQATTTNDADGNLKLDTTTAKGLNASLDIGSVLSNPNVWSIPKSFSLTGSTFTALPGQPKLSEQRGVFVIDLRTTRDDNEAGFDLAQAIEFIRLDLVGKGYVELF